MADHLLGGLNAANPLAYLAALGTLRVLHANPSRSGASPRLGWEIEAGAWRPRLVGLGAPDARSIATEIDCACRALASEQALPEADDLTFSPDTYRVFCRQAAETSLHGRQTFAEFAAALACEAPVNDNGGVQDTAFRTMSGAGHQHFIKTMRNLIAETTSEHIRKALFDTWEYDDPVQNMSLRWDPSDDSRYALRSSDPSGDPDRPVRGAMWGANRLALEALPLLPVMPTQRQLETVGFQTAGARGTFWTWPVWEGPLDADTVRSLLSLPDLQEEFPNRDLLRKRGVVDVFRSQRLTVGKFRNFTWGMPV